MVIVQVMKRRLVYAGLLSHALAQHTYSAVPVSESMQHCCGEYNCLIQSQWQFSCCGYIQCSSRCVVFIFQRRILCKANGENVNKNKCVELTLLYHAIGLEPVDSSSVYIRLWLKGEPNSIYFSVTSVIIAIARVKRADSVVICAKIT